MAQQPRRNEKEEEKRGEKQEEKGRGLEEKWARDRLRAFSVAAILIWGGLVALGGTLDLFNLDWEAHGWSVFLLGVGVILIIKVLIRRFIPEYRRHIGASLIIAIILIAVGIGDLVGWVHTWPVVLIVIGLVILLGTLLRRRK